MSLVETWPSAILSDAVNTTGILKNTALSPGAEVAMSSILIVTPLHSRKKPTVPLTVLNTLANADFSLAIVPLESPLGNW